MPAPLKLVTSWRLSLPFTYSPLPSPNSPTTKQDLLTPKSPVFPFPNGRELTLAVIGATGCGKTTFIKRSLKRRGLTASESKLVEWRNGHISRFIHYQDRRAYINIVLGGVTGMSQTFYNATILEVNVSELINPNDEKPCENGWPTCLPRVDGIFVCYDAADRSSFTNIPLILRGLHRLKIPTMVLALKSDLEQHVSPKEACYTIRNYSGLVELSDQMDKGKEKMRRSVGAFVKMIEDGRRNASEIGSNPAPYRNPALPTFCFGTTARRHGPPSTLAEEGHCEESEDDNDRPVDLRGLSFVDSDPPEYTERAGYQSLTGDWSGGL